MKKVLIVLACVFGVFVIGIGGFAFYMTRGLDTGKNLQIGPIDVSQIADGVYNGTYDGGRWSNEVKVTVKDHKITNIEVVKPVTFEQPNVTEKIVSDVKEKQNTNVDAISGATVTTKAYLKAIENALSSAE